MRRFFILLNLLFFTALCAHATLWGLKSDFIDETTHLPRGNTNTIHLLAPIVAGEPVYYALHTDDFKNVARYKTIIPQFFNAWFEGTLAQIKQAGREEEFKDIIPILARGADIRLTDNDEQARLIIHFIPLKKIQEKFGNGVAGCVDSSQRPLHMYLPTNRLRFILLSLGLQTQTSVSVHEVGHTLGISDQYRRARTNNSDALFSEDTGAPSIMDRDNVITCDDATGLINAIDLVRGTSRGEGWKGLCDSDVHTYQNGLTENKTGYRFIMDEYQHITLENYQNGKRASSVVYNVDLRNNASPFVRYTPVSVEQADAQGRPLKAVGPDGETFFYSYVYNVQMELIVKNGKIKQYNRSLRDSQAKGSAPVYQRDTFFGQDGKLCVISGEHKANKASEVQFLRGLRISKEDAAGYTAEQAITRMFDATGKLQVNLHQQAPENTFPLLTPQDNNAAQEDLSFKIKTATLTAEQKNLYKQLDEWLFNLSDFF